MSSDGEPTCKKLKATENQLSTTNPTSSPDKLNTSIFTLNGSDSSLSTIHGPLDDDSKENTQVSLDEPINAENHGGENEKIGSDDDEKRSSSYDGEEFVDDEEADDEETNDDDLHADLQMWKDMRDGILPVPNYVADGRSLEEQREYILEMIRSYRDDDEQSDYESESSDDSDESSSSGSGSSDSSGEPDDYDLQIDMRF